MAVAAGSPGRRPRRRQRMRVEPDPADRPLPSRAGTDGGLHGYGGGLDLKRQLLTLEGVLSAS